jgi:surfactin synthase thioesterase subunit/NAD(P)-dependent dehydrogenase (short-subunit alcohol dehydrogenase family)/acyl carrier protein
VMRRAAGELYERSLDVAWAEVLPRGRMVVLPTYPFQRERYWVEATPARRSQPDPIEDWFYAPVWRPAPPLASAPRGRWVVVGDGEAEARALEEDGCSCTLLGWDAPADLGSGPLRGVALVCGHGDADWSPVAAASRWLAALLAAGYPARLWITTRGAVSVAESDPVCVPEQALLWGFGRTAAFEHAQGWGGLIDAGADVRTWVEALGAVGEDQALRPSGRFVQRLTRCELPAGSMPRGGGTALVTGGLGGLGLRVARWLARSGVRSLVLVSRRGRETPGADAAVAELEALGARVTLARADVTDEAAMSAVLAGIEDLTAVFHAAGSGDAASSHELGPAMFERMAAKVRGTRVLEALTRGRPLRAFVCFGSIAAVWGAPGQAHYAAANAFQDAWVHQQRARGVPAFAVDWGPWDGGGLAIPQLVQTLERAGVRTLPPDPAIRALERVLGGDRAQVVVANVDWARFLPAVEIHAPRPLLSELRVAGEVRRETAILGVLRGLGPAERLPVLQPVIRSAVAERLGIDRARVLPATNLFDLGVDSLGALEITRRLQSELGLELAPTLLFEHPTVDGLAAALSRDAVLGGAQPTSPVEATMPVAAAPERAFAVDGEALLAPVRSSAWVVVPRPRPQARMRLVCFSYAGGSASVYADWPDELTEGIELCAVQLPGRGGRFGEAPLGSLEELVAAVTPALLPYLDRPFCLFGHCLGAIAMYEVARALREQHGLEPLRLFPSGAAAPRIYALPNVVADKSRFVDLLRFIQFADEQVLASEALVGKMIPVVASDFALAMQYRHRPAPPSAVPITAFAARDDFFAPPAAVERWAEETTGSFRVVACSGEHYFLVPERSAILRVVASEMAYDLASHIQRTTPGDDAHWLRIPAPRPDARLTVVCFPGFGADAATFDRWPELLPESIEVAAIELPGKGARSDELPLAQLEDLVGGAVRALATRSPRPLVFFGHDYGAVLAFEAARARRRRGEALPERLIASAAAGPQLFGIAPIHQFAPDTARAALGLLGFPDDGAVQRQLRSDFGAAWRYVYRPEPPLDLPIDTLLGTEDSFTPRGSISGWSAQTTVGATHRDHAGSHFTPWTDPEPICQAIRAILTAARSALAGLA